MVLRQNLLRIFFSLLLLIVFSCDRYFKDPEFSVIKKGESYSIIFDQPETIDRIDIGSDSFRSSILPCDEFSNFRILTIPSEGYYDLYLISDNDTLSTYSKYLEPSDSTYLSITFLDVKQGDCTIIESTDGVVTIVDGGYGSYSAGYGGWAGSGETYLLNYLQSKGINSVKHAIITHDDLDHKGGILDLISSDDFTTNNLYDGSIPDLVEGDHLSLGDGVTTTILNPPSGYGNVGSNNGSIVLDIEYGYFRTLLTGDIESESENRLLEDLLVEDFDILKVAHHGSRYSSSDQFLDISSPECTIISSGEGNPYNHPHPDLLDRVSFTTIARTDFYGTLRVISDGYSYQIIYER